MTVPASNGNGAAGNDDLVSAVVRLTGMAAELEQAREQIAGLQREVGTLGSRADGFEERFEERLADVGDLLERMSGQIAALAEPDPDQQSKQEPPAYQVNEAPPWWRPGDPKCADTTARLRDWVAEVYRPVFGYLADLLGPCWDRHPLCLAYLDTLHEAWCLLYVQERDAKMVFAQLDWLTRPLLQAVDVMASETRACRDRGHHREAAPAVSVSASLNGHS